MNAIETVVVGCRVAALVPAAVPERGVGADPLRSGPCGRDVSHLGERQVLGPVVCGPGVFGAPVPRDHVGVVGSAIPDEDGDRRHIHHSVLVSPQMVPEPTGEKVEVVQGRCRDTQWRGDSAPRAR